MTPGGERRALAWLVVVAACDGSPEPEVTDVACAVDADNALRGTCTVTLDAPGAVALELTAPDTPPRRFRSDGARRRHELHVWGLRADTDYVGSVGGRSVGLRTGSLPDELAAASVATDGSAFGFDALFQALRCDRTWFVMIDGDGAVVWYQPSDVYDSPIDGYEWSASEALYVAVDRGALELVGVDGGSRERLVAGRDFDGALHHDAERWDGFTYALFEERVGLRDVDGFHVFDGDQLVGSFRLADHLEVPEGGAGNWSHANGINADRDGTVILSLLNFDTVVAVNGDPASPGFLEIAWSAAGSDRYLGAPGFLGAPDALPGSPADGFVGQHNARLHEGRLWLFDNGGDGTRSRAARYVVDPAAGTLTLDRDWWLDERCPIQSGVAPIDGGVLVSCAGSGRTVAFRETEVTPSFSVTATCNDSGVPGGTRALPVRYDP